MWHTISTLLDALNISMAIFCLAAAAIFAYGNSDMPWHVRWKLALMMYFGGFINIFVYLFDFFGS